MVKQESTKICTNTWELKAPLTVFVIKIHFLREVSDGPVRIILCFLLKMLPAPQVDMENQALSPLSITLH